MVGCGVTSWAASSQLTQHAKGQLPLSVGLMDTLELFGHTGARRQTEARRVGSVHFTPGAQKFGVRGGFCGCRLKARLPGPGEEAGFGVWWSSRLGAWPWATSLSPSAQLKSETPLGRVLGGDTRKAVSLGPAGLSVLGEMASRLNTETRDARVPGTRAGLSTQGIEAGRASGGEPVPRFQMVPWGCPWEESLEVAFPLPSPGCLGLTLVSLWGGGWGNVVAPRYLSNMGTASGRGGP